MLVYKMIGMSMFCRYLINRLIINIKIQINIYTQRFDTVGSVNFGL